MILPSIKTPKNNKTRTLSAKIDNLLMSCEMLGGNSPTYQELTKRFICYQESLEQIKPSMKVTNKLLDSQNIEEYLKEKYKPTEIPIREIMTSTDRSASLSFRTYNDTEVSKTLSRRKRKFADNWKEVYFSPNSSNFTERPAEKNAVNKKVNLKNSTRSNLLESLIQKYMTKKLGLISKDTSEKDNKNSIRQNMVKDKRRSTFAGSSDFKVVRILSNARKSLGGNEGLGEIEFFVSELQNWAKNTPEKLMLEKIIAQQHIRERKQHLMEGHQELKLMKYESMATKFVN